MGISDNSSQQPEGKSRPSLLHKGPIDIDHNVLDAMAGRRSARPLARPQRRIWLLVPLMMAAGWWISTFLQPVPANKPEDLAAATTAPPTVTTTALTAPASVATQAKAKPDSGISENKNLVATGAQSDTATSAHSPSSRPQVQSTPTAAIPPKANVTPPAPSATAKAQKGEPQKTAVNGKASTSNKTAAEKSTPAPKTANRKPDANEATKTAAKAVAATSKKSTGPDPDVELLSAIMKHMGKDSDGATASIPTRSVQTIADLVKSCRAKDSGEALSCQRRICEGSWGKAQACPANLAPHMTAKAVTGSSATGKADNAASPAPAPTVITEANAPKRP
jgi:hypothetical protein